jgi:molybdopterin molybdotransferase
MELAEALTALRDLVEPMTRSERIRLTTSGGRIIAAPVVAPVSLPPFPASAMDGYALRHTDWRSDPATAFKVVGQSLAGHPFLEPVAAGEAVRVFTGAVVPPGADLVLLQERAQEIDGRVTFEPHEADETYVRPVGHDIEAGVTMAERGERVTGFTIGSLAAAGIEQVDVVEQPRVGVFSSGDELVDAGTALGPGQIYDSNRVAVLELLRDLPCDVVDLGRLPDESAAVRTSLASAARQVDMMITSGGVSVGDADFITATIEDLGTLSFWRLNLKPGKPLAFGKIDDCYVFGLPGNPVSTIVTLLLLAKPTILHLCGAESRKPLRIDARLAKAIKHAPGRAEYQRGALTEGASELVVTPTGDQSSNRLTTFYGANCLIEIPGPSGDLEPGETVTAIPFWGLL